MCIAECCQNTSLSCFDSLRINFILLSCFPLLLLLLWRFQVSQCQPSLLLPPVPGRQRLWRGGGTALSSTQPISEKKSQTDELSCVWAEPPSTQHLVNCYPAAGRTAGSSERVEGGGEHRGCVLGWSFQHTCVRVVTVVVGLLGRRYRCVCRGLRKAGGEAGKCRTNPWKVKFCMVWCKQYSSSPSTFISCK